MLSVSRGVALEQYPYFQVHTPRVGTVGLEVSGVAELSPYTAAESSKNSAQDIEVVEASNFSSNSASRSFSITVR